MPGRVYPPPVFETRSLTATPIRDLGLTIAGTQLEPIVVRFLAEIDGAGLSRIRPRIYLSTEWGVPADTIALGIPFYLASPELIDLHRAKGGLVEGTDAEDILRYLRHEMGHVVTHAYKLYDDPEWVGMFGSTTQPYRDHYRAVPFHPNFVSHLPGWYAQKHPDEDFAETFAVWMEDEGWAEEYAGRAVITKLQYVDRLMKRLRTEDPLVTDDELDDDVSEIGDTFEELYDFGEADDRGMPVGLDGALRSIGRSARPEGDLPLAALIARITPELQSSVYRWTGQFPWNTLELLRYLQRRATALGLSIDRTREADAIVALTALVSSLAMNQVMTRR